MQTMSALNAMDLIAEYIAHGLPIPMTLKQALDAETLEALNEIEDRIHASPSIDNTDECDFTSVHTPPTDVLCAETL